MKIKWIKNVMNQEEASHGSKFGTLWFSLDMDDWKTGWVFISEGLVVTKKFKTKAAAKKAAEKWLTESQRDSNGTSSKSHKEQK